MPSCNACTRCSVPQSSRTSPLDQPRIGLLFQFVSQPCAGFTMPGIWSLGRKPCHSCPPVPMSGKRGSVRGGRSGRMPAWKYAMFPWLSA
jgi:hypothetical protein